jgi:GMP synthase (glutamine-hydrolysing)
MVATDAPRGILVVDLGAQYAQLIARRIREAGTWSEIAPPARALEVAKKMDLGGVILSGGPASVYAEDAPKIDPKVLELGVPVLGICYGMQWMCQALGGEVKPFDRREFGRMEIAIDDTRGLFEKVDAKTVVWMSHGDSVAKLPSGFRRLANSPTCPEAAVGDPERGFYGVQFHPEVSHTRQGQTVLSNFLYRICRMPGDWKPGNIAEREIAKIRETVGDGEVVLGLSGGVDSSVAAVLLQKAIGPNLHAIFVDNGLLRHGERETVERTFREHFHVDLTVVDATDRFLASLAGVTDPETKRKRIG